MNDDKQLKKDTIEGGCDDCGIKSTNTSRRKFTKGAFAAPVIASLMSNPAWGTGGGSGDGTGYACSISGLRSGNLSGNRHLECRTHGCEPWVWKKKMGAWACTGYSPGSCSQDGHCGEWDCSTGTPFDDVFHFTVGGSNTTLLEILLWPSNFSDGSYYRELVTALLNASCSPWSFGATPQEVYSLAWDVKNQKIDMWLAKKTLKKMNRAGDCFINSQGDCSTSGSTEFVFEDTKGCLPVCQPGYHFDFELHACVPDAP